MLGDLFYWIILAAGALWASLAPRRLREPGLAALAYALVLEKDVPAALAYAGLGTLTWGFVRGGRPANGASAALICGLAAGLLGCEALKLVGGGAWHAPLGLSYLVFRLIHVVVDARRGVWGRPPGAAEFAHFLFTPALFVAGPLERWRHWAAGTGISRNEEIARGVWRLVAGLLKKVMIADLALPSLAAAAGWALPGAVGASSGAAEIWQACFFTYLRIYIEFSGYSDIAVGAGLLWGRRPMENFNWPILANTPQDYWRRWHISIAQWCAECVYMPLLARWRRVAPAMFGSFLVLGLWHWLGWNRVAWAAWQLCGVLVVIWWQRRLGRPGAGSWRSRWAWRLASIAGTQAFVVVGYAFLLHGEAVSVGDSLRLIARMLGWPN